MKNNVDIGYVATPYGDKAIATEVGVSPFSYTSFKPYQGTDNSETHGILYQQDYNPNQYTDPLEGVHFSAADLKQHGLTESANAMVNARLIYQVEHFTAAKERLGLELLEIKSTDVEVRSIPASIAALRALVGKANEEDQQQMLHIVQELEARYPRLRHSVLRIHPAIDEIAHYINSNLVAANQTRMDQLLVELMQTYPKSIQKIQTDYHKHPMITAFYNRVLSKPSSFIQQRRYSTCSTAHLLSVNCAARKRCALLLE